MIKLFKRLISYLFGSKKVVKDSPRSEPGLSINVQPLDHPDQVPVVLKLLKDAKINHIRASWWAWSVPNDWKWFQEFKNEGIDVLPIIYSHPDDGAKFGQSMGRRYEDFIKNVGLTPYVQLDNEVDGDGEFGLNPDTMKGRTAKEQGQRWAEQMKIASERIRSLNPGVQIVTAGVAWNREGVQDFIKGMIEVGGFDVLAIHVYGDYVYGEPISRGKIVRELGWNGPIWVTEFGASDWTYRTIQEIYHGRTGVSQEECDEYQLENWRKVLTEDESRDIYERIYGFQLTPDMYGWGITKMNPPYEPRPTYQWLREWHGK